MGRNTEGRLVGIVHMNIERGSIYRVNLNSTLAGC